MAYKFTTIDAKQYGNVLIPPFYKVTRDDGSYYFLGKEIFCCTAFDNMYSSSYTLNATKKCNGYIVKGFGGKQWNGTKYFKAKYLPDLHLVPVCSWQAMYDDNHNNQSGATITLVGKSGVSNKTLYGHRNLIWSDVKHFSTNDTMKQCTDPRNFSKYQYLQLAPYNGDRAKDSGGGAAGAGWSFAYEPHEFYAIFGFHAG